MLCYRCLAGAFAVGGVTWKIRSAPIIDAKSGVSGAGGRVEDDVTNFVSVNENFKAYKVFSHQHQPEIQQYLQDLSPYSSDVTGEIILTPIYFRLAEEFYPRFTSISANLLLQVIFWNVFQHLLRVRNLFTFWRKEICRI